MRTLCKKALAFCLVAALALTCFVGTFSVSAAEFGATITVAPVTVEQGETSVPVVLAVDSAVAGINEALIKVSSTVGTIDAEATLVKDAAGTAYTEDELNALDYSIKYAQDVTDYGSFYLSGKTFDLTTTSVFIKVVFTVAADKAAGDYAVAIDIPTDKVIAASGNEDVIKFTYEEAKITIVLPHVHNVIWTPDTENAGYHTSSCNAEGCPEFTGATEPCADENEDGVCDVCLYVFPVVDVCEHANITYVSHVNAEALNDGSTKNGSITYTCNDCGETKTEDVIYNNTYRVRGASAMYASEILLNFNLYIDEWSETADLTKSFGVLIKDDNTSEDAAPITQATRVSETPIDLSNKTHTVHYLTYPCAAKELADNFDYALIAYVDGVWYCGKTGTYSFATYANNMLAKSSTLDTEKTLIADILNYGAAAQDYFDYNESNPVNKVYTAFDGYLADYATKTDRATVKTQTVTNTGSVYKIGAASASFASRTELNIRINTASGAKFTGSTDDVVVTVTYFDVYENDTVTVKVEDFMSADGQTYAVFSNLFSYQMSDTVTVKLYNAATYVEGSDANVAEGELIYSLETYAHNKINANDGISSLCKMLIRFSDAAKLHFKYNINN